MIRLGVNTASLQKKQDIVAKSIVDFIIEKRRKILPIFSSFSASKNVVRKILLKGSEL